MPRNDTRNGSQRLRRIKSTRMLVSVTVNRSRVAKSRRGRGRSAPGTGKMLSWPIGEGGRSVRVVACGSRGWLTESPCRGAGARDRGRQVELSPVGSGQRAVGCRVSAAARVPAHGWGDRKRLVDGEAGVARRGQVRGRGLGSAVGTCGAGRMVCVCCGTAES